MFSKLFYYLTILLFLFSATVFAQDYVDLSTPNHVLRVFEDGRMVDGNENAAFDFIDDCDTFNVNTNSDIYLYGGTPLISYIDGTDTLLFHMYQNSTPEVNGFVASEPIVFDDVSSSSYSYAKCNFTTANGAIGMTVEYFAPKHPDSADYIIQKNSLYTMSSSINGVNWGVFLDWNVPSDSGDDNGSGFDMAKNMVYQFGAEYGQDDSTEALCPQESDERYGAIWEYYGYLRNAATVANANFEFQPGPVYRHMYEESGFSIFEHSHPDSQYQDISTFLTINEYNLTLGDTLERISIIGVVKDGYSELQSIVNSSYNFIGNHPEIAPPLTCCTEPGGDVNSDGSFNVGDAVYLINYCFKGGPRPPCPQEADTNHDCKIDIGDVVAMIARIFRGFDPFPMSCAPPECEYEGYDK
ncbi:MAG: dockerin type I repeat-containing protein [candidate division Zixibacteria bacterium]|nr:dockerin type I repeat-containing protein [candidate division Zixibacteria bacterium]